MHMNSDFDFNIDNYTIEDIYRLFNLEITVPLDNTQLRKTKQVIVKIHPDKSKLPKEYFVFFSKAYLMLVQIAECTQGKRGTPVEYSANEYYNAEIHQHINNNSTEIRQEFNRKFMHINADIMPESQGGHGEWFRRNDDHTSSGTLSDHSKIFSRHQEMCSPNTNEMSIAIMSPDLMTDRVGYSMLDEDPQEFTSGMFGMLQYADLKKSYTHSLFDISEKALLGNTRPETVDQLTQSRGKKIVPLSTQQSQTMLAEHWRNETEISTHRAYRLVKQLENSQIKTAQMTNLVLKY